MKTKKKVIKRELLAHGDYSISNRRPNIIAIPRGIFILFGGILKQLRTYSTIPIGVLWNLI